MFAGTAIKVESEIYLYRTKCGKYNSRKSQVVAPANNKNREGDEGPMSKKKDEQANNPRKMFSFSLDRVWMELASSGRYYRLPSP